MNKIITKFITFICSFFNEQMIKQVINSLNKILADKYYKNKPKDSFKEKHPNYRDFNVDPLAPKIKKKNQK
jgi:predicted ATP-dependent Lon-type protease